ncbi:MAG: ABC transporter permease [Polyangiaceae bacterium]|nr:ABC transporter permease [Polyangiaceae bacterium]
MLFPLLAVMLKEFRQTFRDRRMVAMLLVAPVIQLILLGFAVDLEVDHIPTVIVDLDRTRESRELGAALVADTTFSLVGYEPDPEQAYRYLERGTAATVVVLPVGLARDLVRHSPVTIQVLVDGTDPNRAQVASNAAAQFFAARAMTTSVDRMAQALAAQGRTRTLPQIRLLPRILYNPRLKSAVYMVPGVAALVLLAVTTIVTAMGISREREDGTLEQILVTPLRPLVLLLGKCLPFALIGLVDVWATLTVGSYLFGVPIRGSFWVITLATLLYLFTTLGAGIFISTVSQSQQQAILGGIFFFMPAILLSGFMTPIENMPHWLLPLTYLDPVRYYVEVLRGYLLKGSGFADLGQQLGALAAIGVGLITVSALRFRKRLG